MFECVVCGVCTRDALVYSVAHPTEKVVAVCGGPYCKRAFRKNSRKYLTDRADRAESG